MHPHNKTSKENFYTMICIIFYIKNELSNSTTFKFKELEILRKNLNKEELLWEDGKQTVGKHAAKVKNNLQLKRESELSKKFSGLIIKRFLVMN